MPNITIIVPMGSRRAIWQLADNHYIPAKMQAVIIHPRPDGETNSWERHRLAPSDIAWRIPIGVQGGSWPFNYTVDVTSAGKGILIGSNHGDADYGILSWASPTVGAHTISVTVATQERDRYTSGFAEPAVISFTLTVVDKEDTTKFIFVDSVSGNDTTGDGTFTTPYATFLKMADQNFAGRQIFFRTGTYTMDLTAAGNVVLDASNPNVYVGYPGETATFDYASNKRFTSGTIGGVYIANITFDGSIVTTNHRTFSMFLVQRATWFENTVTNFVANNGNDNEAFVMFNSGDPFRQYACFSHNTFASASNLGNGSFVILYNAQYALFEGNSVGAITAQGAGTRSGALMAKGQCDHVTYRNNSSLVDQDLDGAIWYAYLGDDGSGTEEPGFNEICYNVALQTTAGTQVAGGAGYASASDIWVYRNTVTGRQSANSGAGVVARYEGNVVMSVAGTLVTHFGNGTEVDEGNNVVDTFANKGNYIDSNGLLVGTPRTDNLGISGHEVN